MQLRDVRAYASSRGLSIFKEYIDDGISGRKDKRPALCLLMNDARKRRGNSGKRCFFRRCAITDCLKTSLISMSRCSDLNRGPTDYEANTLELPALLKSQEVFEIKGFCLFLILVNFSKF